MGEGVTAGPACHPDCLHILWQPLSPPCPSVLAAVFLGKRQGQGVPFLDF